jgi:ribose transport system ATP-binding protein
MSAPLLAVTGAVKHFGGVQALRGVDFDLHAGEIHALLGENGAGKTTLMNILSGVHAPDAGTITIEGAPVRFANPREAQAAGIATIFQELDLVPSLDVAANLFLGHELVRPGGLLDVASMRREARKRLEAIELDIDVERRVRELSIGHRQVVAIVKALSYATRVLIMDEPTAALTVGEVNRLFAIMRRLSASGVGIVYISHRLEEVPQIADRVTVMRDGRVAGVTKPDAPQAELVQLLVGRPLEELYPKRAAKVGRPRLHLRNARFRPTRESSGWQVPKDVSFDVHEGEIVGLAGVMGAGRTELLSALYGTGLRGRWEGAIEVDGRPVRLNSIKAARRAGIAFVTDDRRGGGLMLRLAVGRNLVMSVIRRISPYGLMSAAREREAVEESFGRFAIRPRNPDIAVGALSGGNQQKVVLAKDILGNPRLLLLDEPTRGVDVGAKGEIYARLRDLASQGLGILVASSEMPELIGLCDRILVLREGRNVAEFKGGVDEHTLLAAASGKSADV